MRRAGPFSCCLNPTNFGRNSQLCFRQLTEKAVSPWRSNRPGYEFEYRRREAFFLVGFTAAILLVQDTSDVRRHAAEQVDAAAQFALGAIYSGGKDYVLAHRWTNIAIANGIEEAAEFRGGTGPSAPPDSRAAVNCNTIDPRNAQSA